MLLGLSAPARLITGALGTPLLWLALVWVTWIPSSRPLTVNLLVDQPTTLTVFRDIGRDFYPPDAAQYDVESGATSQRIALPTVARAIRLELALPSAAIGAVWLAGMRVAGPIEKPDGKANTVTIRNLPRIEQPPSWLTAICAFAALTVMSALLTRSGSRRVALLWRQLAQPDVVTSLPGAAAAWTWFGLVLVLLRCSTNAFDVLFGPIDNPPHWPISIFDPRQLTIGVVGMVALLMAAAYSAARVSVQSRPSSMPIAFALSVCILIAGNALYGWHGGFVEPTASDMMYWPDAHSIVSWREFLATFAERQPNLRTHGRTHPPGAELLYYVLIRLIGDPGAVGVLLGAGSALLTCAFVYGILHQRCGKLAATFGALSLACIPAVQIYSITTLDAVICASVMATLYCFLHRAWQVRVLGAGAFLAVTMSLTFASLFLFCVLPLFDLVCRRSLRTSAGSLGIAALLYGALAIATGFNWLNSLFTAAHLENPRGFTLLSSPGTYIFTRIECVAEIALFAGPSLLILWFRGLAVQEDREPVRELRWLSILGSATLLAMLAAGAFKTGETARTCLFFYPFIVLPLAAQCDIHEAARARMVFALLAQALVMQAVGDYFW